MCVEFPTSMPFPSCFLSCIVVSFSCDSAAPLQQPQMELLSECLNTQPLGLLTPVCSVSQDYSNEG